MIEAPAHALPASNCRNVRDLVVPPSCVPTRSSVDVSCEVVKFLLSTQVSLIRVGVNDGSMVTGYSVAGSDKNDSSGVKVSVGVPDTVDPTVTSISAVCGSPA